MHFPYYLQIGEIRLHPHIFFESLAYLLGFILYRALRSRYGDPIPSGTRWSVVAAAAFGGALGSKLLFWLENPSITLAHIHDVGYLMGGKSIVGGLIGGVVCVELGKRAIGEARRTGDLFAVPLCFGIALGRIGCFLTGLSDETYGIATSLPWAIDFGDGVRRLPVQLYEILFLIGLGFYLLRRMSHPHVNGSIFREFMIGYMAWRLLIDFLKPYPTFAGFNSIQWACITMLAWYAYGGFRGTWTTNAHFIREPLA